MSDLHRLRSASESARWLLDRGFSMRPLTRKERAGGIVAAFVTEGVAVYAYSDWRWSAETLVPSIDKDGARRFFVTGYLGTSERALRALTKLVEEAKP